MRADTKLQVPDEYSQKGVLTVEKSGHDDAGDDIIVTVRTGTGHEHVLGLSQNSAVLVSTFLMTAAGEVA